MVRRDIRAGQMEGAMADSNEVLPDWIGQAGGENAWRKWIKTRIGACQRRAAEWARKRRSEENLPSRKEWQAAVYKAIHDSKGLGSYSHLPLSLNRGKPTDWNWPSLDHVSGPAEADVVLETRLACQNGTTTGSLGIADAQHSPQ